MASPALTQTHQFDSPRQVLFGGSRFDAFKANLILDGHQFCSKLGGPCQREGRSRSPMAMACFKQRRWTMNWDRIEGNWKQFTGKVKEKWGKLTDDEIAQIDGNREQLEGKIQARYGYAKDQVRKDVDDWLNRM